MRYSLFSLVRNAVTGASIWPPAWRSPEPAPAYDAVIIGGGGHGLATAYYLAKNHGIRNVAVLEKGWLGGGNTGRNTTIVRSTYWLDENARFYEHSLKLWEGLARELNYNLMFSQRGVINIFHNQGEWESWARRYNAMRCNGIDAIALDRAELKKRVPALDVSATARFPILGGLMQPRGGVARHDAVAWGFARAADRLGVDIIQNCEVTGISRDGGRVTGVETSRGAIKAAKVGICVAGHSSRVAALAGLRLPIESHLLQAMVSEPVKPFLDTEVSSGAYHTYVSQTDRGEVLIGGALDGYNSYTQRGSLPTIEHVLAGALAQFPVISRLRLMRTWGGIMDMSMDGSPIISKTPIEGLYLNGGWCYGGFKATPGAGWVFAHTMANDAPHELNAAFSLERFSQGQIYSERGAGNTPNAH
ncbi:MAG: sarcosine oxidase subunit beta family protein [Alphaproteobacteria bacterium]|jgi:sarcosine oxidase subunit beta|nr:sarcosine oxidase subunit beta family protein [Alphaproteobacteria bacterium]MDP7164624.1 sarcosine oxidase subunit beta family protein [Alphaproteobacteria bacterium]